VYIAIRKVYEDESAAEFCFGLSEDRLGRTRLDKATGQLSLIEPAPGDSQSRVYCRVAFKIKEHWEAGELPAETCWAS
jgi:hypothetical protein